jgi:site-specific recombinase XerC
MTADGASALSRVTPPGKASAGETRRLYQVDWGLFETWCAAHQQVALPAAASTVAAFLREAATTRGAGTLARRASAIGARHRRHGLVSPAADPAVKAVLRSARHDAVPRRAPPPKPEQLVRLAAACSRDPAGLRDRALLLLLARNRLGPGALVGLDVEHISFTATAVELSVNAADERVERLTVPSDANRSLCPVQALHDWLERSDTQFGPVFRKIDRWGNIEHHRLGADAIRYIVTRRIPRRARKPRKATGQGRVG